MIEAVQLAKEDPEIAADLSKKLTEANNDEEVAEAIITAKTKALIKREPLAYKKV